MENSCSHETQQLLQTIESNNPFDVVFIDFWEPGDIPDRYVSCKILTCLDCMKGFGLGAETELKEITSGQATQWAFRNFFFPFGIPKVIVMEVDGISVGMFKKTFQETLLIPEHYRSSNVGSVYWACIKSVQCKEYALQPLLKSYLFH